MSAETTIHHHVTIDYGTDGYNPALSLTCTAPADASCHAEWDCGCEEFTWADNNADSLPVHTVWDDEGDDEIEHVGKFGKGCNLVDWFAESDEVLRGKVTVPVKPEWDGDGYEFVLGGETR